MKRDVLTVPNLLSIARLLLAVPFVAVTLSGVPGARLWGASLLLVGALTDKLDGVLARRLSQESEWGRILDPVADKVGIAAVGITLLALGDIPFWFVTFIVLRDVLILAGGLLLKRRRGVVLPSNTAGKWAVTVVSVTMLASLLGVPEGIGNGFIGASTAILAVSTWLYMQRFLEIVRQPERADGTP